MERVRVDYIIADCAGILNLAWSPVFIGYQKTKHAEVIEKPLATRFGCFVFSET